MNELPQFILAQALRALPGTRISAKQHSEDAAALPGCSHRQTLKRDCFQPKLVLVGANAAPNWQTMKTTITSGKTSSTNSAQKQPHCAARRTNRLHGRAKEISMGQAGEGHDERAAPPRSPFPRLRK